MVIGAPNNLGLIDWRSSIHIRARSRARAGHVAEHVAEQVASSEPARRQRSAYVTSQRREQGDGGGTHMDLGAVVSAGNGPGIVTEAFLLLE